MSAAVVAHARTLLDDLISAELRPGGTDEAMHAIARRERIPFARLWALRYRPPKDVYASVFLALAAAHDRMCVRQVERYRAAQARQREALSASAGLARMAASVLGERDGED